jgi:hypothetical protein
MEEVIKYFESLEARMEVQESERKRLEERIMALSQAQKESVERIEAIAERLHTNESKLLAVGKHVASMVAILEDLRNRPQVAPEEKPLSHPKSQPVAEPEEQKLPELPEIQENPEPAVEQVAEPVVEQVSEPVVEQAAEPIAESVEAEKEEPSSPKAVLYGKPVDDIRLAISLGDRFLYQRELFGQNAELMQRTLNELNELGSFEEAIAYISRFGWDTESKTYQQFLVTLHRRFG